jgi:hypothetical protein
MVSVAIGSVHRLLRRCMQPRGKICSAVVEEVGWMDMVVPSGGGAPYPGHLLATVVAPDPLLVEPLPLVLDVE